MRRVLTRPGLLLVAVLLAMLWHFRREAQTAQADEIIFNCACWCRHYRKLKRDEAWQWAAA